MNRKAPPVCGVLLAGGQSRRMGGGDKCLRPLGGRTILSHIVERARPQVDTLVLNANGDPDRFAEYGLPVVPDSFEGFAGPLAGVLTGMEWARENAPNCSLIVTIPTDAPFFPGDLIEALEESLRLGGAELACASSNGRPHPVFGLWPVRLAPALRAALEDGVRKVDQWTGAYRMIEVEFPASDFDPFFNTNRPEDLEEAERLLAAQD